MIRSDYLAWSARLVPCSPQEEGARADHYPVVTQLEADVDMSDLEELSSVLWRERELLDLLAFKLEVEQLVLESGRTQHLARAAREVETVLDSLRGVELGRAVTVGGVVARLGLAPDPSLRQLAAQAPAPWDTIMSEHHEALTRLIGEVRAIADANKGLLNAGQRAVRETLAMLGDEAGTTYGSDGTTAQGSSRRPGQVDRSI